MVGGRTWGADGLLLPEARTELIKSFSLIKSNVLAAPFERAFALQRHLEANPPPSDAVVAKEELMGVHYRYVLRSPAPALPLTRRSRSPEEAIYIQASADRVTVIFSTVFKEETDRIFGKVFLQEFVDARRRPSCQTAPQVLYSNREPPLEIRHLPGLDDSDNVGYVTFGACCSRPCRSQLTPLLLSSLHHLSSLSTATLDARSPFPSPLLDPHHRLPIHHPDPALPRLPALSHQVLQGLHALPSPAPRFRVPEGPQ